MSVPVLDSKLVPFSRNFVERIVAEPGRFRVTVEEAEALAVVQGRYEAAAVATFNRGDRSPALTAERESAKALMLPELRSVYARVQASTAVADADKLLVGVVVRAERRTVPPPQTEPIIWVGERWATTVRLFLRQPGSGKGRARPTEARGAVVFSHVGPTPPPTTLDGWTMCGQTAGTTYDVVFPSATPPGTTVYFAAYWYNRRGERGPVSSPVSAIIAGGGVAKMAA